MATLPYSEISNLALDESVSNVTTDAPTGATELLRAINQAYALVWEIDGGGIKTAASATLWTSAQTATGTVVGILAGIRKILDVFASTTSGSVGQSSGDNQLDPCDFQEIQFLRKSSLPGTYSRPQKYSLIRMQPASPASATAADVGLLQLDYWPSVTGFYLPAIYEPEFVAMDGGASDCPNTSDLGSYDIGYIAGAILATREGRAELVPSIVMKVSETTMKLQARKIKALLDAAQGE